MALCRRVVGGGTATEFKMKSPDNHLVVSIPFDGFGDLVGRQVTLIVEYDDAAPANSEELRAWVEKKNKRSNL